MPLIENVRRGSVRMDYVSYDMGPVVMLPNPEEPWQLEEYRNPMTVEVAEIGSFEEYCRGHFGWNWFEGLRLRLTEKQIPVGKTSPAVPAPDMVFMEGAEILRIEFSRMDRSHFYADAIITADIELSQNINGKLHKDRVSQWYRDRCIFEVFPGGYNLTEQSVTIYDSKEKSPGQPLTEYLVPVLDEEALELEAEDMLRLYYPEAFMQPMPVDGMKLAARMGLTVLDVPLWSEKKIMGQSVFLDGTVLVTDGEQRKAQMKVCPNMILVNTNCGMNDLQRNDTIIHECVHHYEHDLFVWGQSLYRSDIYGINCPVIEGAFTLEGQSPMRWAEQQARLLTYRLKMNRLQTERMIQQTERELCGYSVPLDKGRFSECIIQKLGECFFASKQSVRKRMLELGHESVRGVLNYVNGEYIPPYFFSPGLLDKNQTFVISMKDAAEEYGRNGRFRELADSGCYVYVEGKFCINKPEYVRRGRNGKLYLTNRARNCVECCCLLFEFSYGQTTPQYAAGRFNRESAVIEVRGQKIVCPQNAAEPGLCSPQDFMKEATWIMGVRKAIGGMEFNDALVYLMKERKMTIEQLEEKTQISSRTISRLRNNQDYDVTWAQIVALAIGLQLPPAISHDLLAKVGLQLRNNVAHNVYNMILSSFYTLDIETVNSYLCQMGLSPLTELANAG